MNIKNLVISIIIGLVIFVVGGGVGVLYQQKKEPPAAPIRISGENSLVKILNSKVIPSIAAYGQVVNINKRNITLISGNEDFTVKINDVAPVYYFVASAQKSAKFEDIKRGDTVRVELKFLSNNQIEGYSVIIIPPTQ